ncbi:MAG: hypothetical protein JWL79_3858 [Frankiales bacterium]|nr:hypothetical protein [Frankiales bacterium]
MDDDLARYMVAPCKAEPNRLGCRAVIRTSDKPVSRIYLRGKSRGQVNQVQNLVWRRSDMHATAGRIEDQQDFLIDLHGHQAMFRQVLRLAKDLYGDGLAAESLDIGRTVSGA